MDLTYLLYEEFKELGGEISEPLFSRLEIKARKDIDRLTFNRLIKIENKPVSLKYLMFELINLDNKTSLSSDTRLVTSESNNSISKSYYIEEEKEYEEKRKMLIKSYLHDVKTADGNSIFYMGI